MKNLITLITFVLCFNIGNAQENLIQNDKRWYIQLKAGYGIPFNNAEIESPLPIFDFHNADFNNNAFSKNDYGTIGDGFKTEFKVGRVFTDHISLELGCRYSITSEIMLAKIDSPTFIGTHQVSSQWMEVNPGVVLSTGFQKKFSIYANIALAIPIFGHTNSIVEINDLEGRIATYYLPVYEKQLGIPLTEGFTSQVVTQLDVEARTNGGSSLGLNTALGAALKIAPTFKLVAEIAVQTLNIRTLDSKYLDYTQTSSFNGSPLDIEVPVYIREINFVDEINNASNNSTFNPEFSIDQPQDELALKPNFSNVSLMVGLQYAF